MRHLVATVTLLLANVVATIFARGDSMAMTVAFASRPVLATVSVSGIEFPDGVVEPISFDLTAVADADRSVDDSVEAESPALGLIGIGLSGLIALRRFRKFFS